MEKKAKIYRLLKFYMEPAEATNILDMIAPLIKEADDDYLQGMIVALPRRLFDEGLQKARDFLDILKTMGSALSGTMTSPTRTTNGVWIPILSAGKLGGLSRIMSPFRCTQLSDTALSSDYDDFTNPRSIYYADQKGPTTSDYGIWYREEYYQVKEDVQALRAQEVADAEALRAQEAAAAEELRAQEAALRVQQGTGQGQ